MVYVERFSYNEARSFNSDLLCQRCERFTAGVERTPGLTGSQAVIKWGVEASAGKISSALSRLTGNGATLLSGCETLD